MVNLPLDNIFDSINSTKVEITDLWETNRDLKLNRILTNIFVIECELDVLEINSEYSVERVYDQTDADSGLIIFKYNIVRNGKVIETFETPRLATRTAQLANMKLAALKFAKKCESRFKEVDPKSLFFYPDWGLIPKVLDSVSLEENDT